MHELKVTLNRIIIIVYSRRHTRKLMCVCVRVCVVNWDVESMMICDWHLAAAIVYYINTCARVCVCVASE